MELLEKLCAIPGTSGDERAIRDFILAHCKKEMAGWKNKPGIWEGDGFQDNLALIFGNPKVALYAHLDTVGYTIRYDNYVVSIGGIDGANGDDLVFSKDNSQWHTKLVVDEDNEISLVDFTQKIEPGTTLTYAPDFSISDDFVKSPYLDDRLGVWALLQLAPKAENVALVFTTFEEHGGGGAGLLARLLFERYKVSKAIVADVTWSTPGVIPGKGPVISLRDSRIPRKVFVDRLREIAVKSKIPFQLEVEFQGGSDGREIQNIPYPIDWCFIGPPSENPHSSLESVHVKDVASFVELLNEFSEKI